MKELVTIGGIQMKMSRDLDANLEKAGIMVRQAARRGARIICLPELFRSPYFPQYKRPRNKAERYEGKGARDFAESVPGESTNAFSCLAKELRVVIIVPLFERAHDSQHYNSAVVIDERGRLLPAYRKIHLPQDP